MRRTELKSSHTPIEERLWFKVWPSHLPRNLKYPHVPAWWILERNLNHFGHKDAVISIDHKNLDEIERLTYQELWQRANSLAVDLREFNVKKGDRVATLLPNSPALVVSYYGIWMAGASITPCNAMAKEKELEYQLTDSGARLLIAAKDLSGLAVPVAERLGLKVILLAVDGSDQNISEKAAVFEKRLFNAGRSPSHLSIDPAEDIAVLLYTGGTTGVPKGAMLTHRNIVANTIQFAEWYALEPGAETFICTIPMSHSGGMTGVMNVPLYSGATLVLMKRFVAEAAAKAIEKYHATRFFSVPTTYIAILNSAEARRCDLSSLKACRTNAAPLPVAVKESFDRWVGKEILIEGYGLTETSPLTHANPLTRAKAGSIGIPIPDTDCKIVDIETGEDLSVGREGELVIRGPQLMKGYWNRPEETAKAFAGGWFHTGDVGKMDEDGYFFILDRLKDMINTGGYKVWPRDVEEILFMHPKVRQAAVIGCQDSYYGEIVKAFVVPKEEAAETITSEEIIAFCKRNMSNYKVPRAVEFCRQLEVSPQGKVLRCLLRDEGIKKT
jgi:long-chain acyl-CoA synthetase